jgi:hypothetical protein
MKLFSNLTLIFIKTEHDKWCKIFVDTVEVIKDEVINMNLSQVELTLRRCF